MNEDKKYQDFTRETTFKGVVHHKSHTDENKAWYEETHEAIPIIKSKDIWQDAEHIPSVPIPQLTRYIAHIGQQDVQIYKYIEDLPLSPTDSYNSFYNKDFVDIIDKDGYNVILKCDGEEVPFGLNKWSYDGYNGYLTFVNGLPNGWDGQFTISFYKYTGRKLNEVNLYSDGSRQMNDGYVPQIKQDIATKQYVDSHVGKTDDVVNKLIPPEPPTLSQTYLDFYAEGGEFKGSKVLNGDEVENIVFENQLVTLTSQRFYNAHDYGKTTLVINNFEVESISHKNPVNTSLITVIYNDDYYKTDLNSKGFFDGLELQVQFRSTDIPLYLRTSNIIQIKLVTSFPSGDKYETKPVTIGIENTPKAKGLSEERDFMLKLLPEEVSWKNISGVPTLAAGSKIAYSGVDNVTLNNYFIKEQSIGNVKIGDSFVDILPKEIGYEVQMNPKIPIEGTYEVPENYYNNELLPVELNTFNILNNSNGHWVNDYPIRIDTVTDESLRVFSTTSKMATELSKWDGDISLADTLELQALNNKYMWPEIDFSKNGQISWVLHYDTKDWIKAGPNYSNIPTTGKRYATFKYTIPYSNGVYITIPELDLAPTFKNFKVASLEVKVKGFTGWLDANKPYDGIGSVKENGEGCLVVRKCNEHTIYITFGPNPIYGDFYIRVGVTHNNFTPFTAPTIKANI